MDTKLKRLLIVLLVLFLSLFSIILYSRYIGTSGLFVKEYAIKNNKIPSSFDGVKIIHFTDLHYGRTVSEKELENIVNTINKYLPDIVFFTGDLIDKDTLYTDEIGNKLRDALSRIESKLGKFIVRGNHDIKFSEYENIIKNSGFKLLDNEYEIIYNKSNEYIYIGGLNNVSYKKSDLSKLFNDDNIDKLNDIYRIVLVHEPDYTDTILSKNNVDLILSGHSHNGQVRLPFIGALTKPNLAKKYYLPHYKINNTDLFISSGIGVSNMNFRFFNRPSINLYRLIKST